MLSRNANYDMDTALEEINQKELLLDVKAETQVILQILVANGITTKEEIDNMRVKVRNSSKYKPLYEYLENAKQKANYYKSNPQEHLKDVMNAKMNGTLK